MVKLRVVILLVIFSLVCKNIYENVTITLAYQKQNKVISYIEDYTFWDTEYEEKTEYVVDEYIGYIEVPSLKIRNLIKEGTNKFVLDKNYVGYVKHTAFLNSEEGNIVLAGHNNKYVFGPLHKISIGDIININDKIDNKIFKVVEKYEIDETDLSVFDSIKDNLQLTLITCTNIDKKRLIVVGELSK